MAKSKKRAPKKTDKLSIELQLCLGALVVAFLCIVAALQWGIVGIYIDYAAKYLVGNYFGVIYGLLLSVSIYVFFKKKLPRFSGPKAIGIYMLLGALLMFAGITNSSLKGQEVLDSFIKYHTDILGGGIIGAILYSACSILFGYQGSVILAIIVGLTGSLILIGKSYLELMKSYLKNIKQTYTDKPKKIKKEKNKKKSKNDQEEDEPSLLFPFNQKKKTPLFSEKAFEDDESGEHIEPILDRTRINHFDQNHVEEKTKDIEPVNVVEDKNDSDDQVNIEMDVPINKNYRLPSIALLKDNPNKTKSSSANQFALDNAERLARVLEQFGVKATVSDIFIGPSVIKYELKLDIGMRVNKITSLQDDIKMALAARDIRIEAPIPGKMAVGIEIPNQESTLVTLKEVFKDIPEAKKVNKLLVPLGKDVTGQSVYAELDKMPHLLIAGATGSGKSICINGIITSILMRAKPDEVKLLLVDPKKVELTTYNHIPHLMCPVVTDPKKAAVALRKIVTEMERRYDLFALANTRNIAGYNEMANIFNQSLNEEDKKEILPYIVVILDEVADLMQVAGKEVEDCIMRISQMARAAGIHLIVATQRPSTDVITGVIKANIPSRIAFAVSSSIDSRTILDASGAERLLGKGDMLFSPMGASNPTRLQGSFISEKEVQDVVDFVIKQQEAKFDINFASLDSKSSNQSGEESEDEIYEDVREFVITNQKASASLLQRHFRLGYNRAARLIDELEANGIIGPQLGSKPREVLIKGYKEEEI